MIYNGLLLLTCIFLVFGVIGIYRLNNLYAKLLTSSKIDTVSVITLLLALIIKTGFSTMTLKLIILFLFVIMTNPVTNHFIARLAYKGGYREKVDND